MAGDWIKVEKSTPRKPEVLRIAAALSIRPDEAFGLCFRFWAWCDDNLVDCNAPSVTPALLDLLLERPGFADALIDVEWLGIVDGSVVIPNFDRHLSESAKKRALTLGRVKNSRAKCNADSVTEPGTPALQKRYQRREEKSINRPPPPPQGGDAVGQSNRPQSKAAKSQPPKFDALSVEVPQVLATDAFLVAWSDWVHCRRERRKPLTERMVAEQLAAMAKAGPNASIEAIRSSITNGYTGVFPEKFVNPQQERPSRSGPTDERLAKNMQEWLNKHG